MEFLPMNFSFPASPIPDLSLCTLYHDSLISAFLICLKRAVLHCLRNKPSANHKRISFRIIKIRNSFFFLLRNGRARTVQFRTCPAFLFVAYYIGKSSDDHFANLQTVLENADNFLMAQYFVSAVHDQRGVGKPFEHFLRDAEL